MKTRLLAALLAALLLSACAQAPQESASRMTQSIARDGLGEKFAAAQPEGASTPDVSGPTSPPQGDAGAYYRAKAERDVLELERDLLEADYRVGKLPEAEFSAQKESIEQERRRLKLEEERLERAAQAALPAPARPEGGVDALLERLWELERREDALESEEDLLEQDYLAGRVSREDYIDRQADLLRRDDALDEEADLLEDALEILGWDD